MPESFWAFFLIGTVSTVLMWDEVYYLLFKQIPHQTSDFRNKIGGWFKKFGNGIKLSFMYVINKIMAWYRGGKKKCYR